MHLFGFSPLCILKCILRDHLPEKVQSHWLHLLFITSFNLMHLLMHMHLPPNWLKRRKTWTKNMSKHLLWKFFNFYISHPLPGEMNISQLQGKIKFNTFFFWKPYNWYIKLLNIILVVPLVGWWVLLVILVIFGDFWWFWVIFWWFLMDFSTYLAI